MCSATRKLSQLRSVIVVSTFALFAGQAAHAGTAPRLAQIGSLPVNIEVDPKLRNRFSAAFDALEFAGTGTPQYTLRVEILESTESLPSEAAEALQHKGGFWLAVGEAACTLYATNVEGVVNGLTTFQLKLEAGSLTVGNHIDKPVHELRALHFVLRGLDKNALTHLVDQARRARMNLLVVSVTDALRLDTFADTARDDALTAADFATFVANARANGLDVIPEIKLLTHQEKFLKNRYPQFMFNSRTYDPRNQELSRLVLRYVEEVIELINPVAIHIGHDELRLSNSVGQANGLRRGEQPLPATLYHESIRSIHAFLEERNVETWIWGDMLLLPDEFPAMNERSLHGTAEFRDIRHLLPRDIVVCDWQYYEEHNFPSAKLFSDMGFRVIGATWKRTSVTRAFSSYAAQLPTSHGMIATTWFEVQRRNWDTVDRIIAESGAAFWHAN